MRTAPCARHREWSSANKRQRCARRKVNRTPSENRAPVRSQFAAMQGVEHRPQGRDIQPCAGRTARLRRSAACRHGVDVRQSRKAAQQDIVGIKLARKAAIGGRQHPVLVGSPPRAPERVHRDPAASARCALRGWLCSSTCACSSAPASAAPGTSGAARTRRRPARFPARRTPAASLPGRRRPARRVRCVESEAGVIAEQRRSAGRIARRNRLRRGQRLAGAEQHDAVDAGSAADPATRNRGAAGAARRRPRRFAQARNCGVRAAIGRQREMRRHCASRPASRRRWSARPSARAATGGFLRTRAQARAAAGPRGPDQAQPR